MRRQTRNLSECSLKLLLDSEPEPGQGRADRRAGRGWGEEVGFVLAPPPPLPRYRERAGPLGFGVGVAPALGR